MGKNLVEKILSAHLLRGEMQPGQEIVVSVDQTLAHDLTGFIIGQILDAVDAGSVRVDPMVFYCDHNVLCTEHENTDIHYFLRTCAARFGAYYSRPGNGVCHTVHCERFAVPGALILGSDSHTPTSGAVGALAIGTGGLSVARAALGEGFRFGMPRVTAVRLTGTLRPGVSGKDVALEIMRLLTVRGGVGSVLEYCGDGVAALNMGERMTIANMCIETGATSGVFPSDGVTREFLEAQQRGESFRPLAADPDAHYDSEICIDLSALVPLAACPDSPDNVSPAAEHTDVRPDSVFIGSCTNSSYTDLARAAAIMRGRRVHPDVDCTVAPGSRQVLAQIIADGTLETLTAAGCRLLECACGPCLGVGQVPRWNGVSVRTSNRNFPGRTGSKAAVSYLVSPETAAATAVAGRMCTAEELGVLEAVEAVSTAPIRRVDDGMLLPPLPESERAAVELVRGPRITRMPRRGPLRAQIEAGVSIRLGDNITTDDIIPGGATLKYISDLPAFAEFMFCYQDPEFVKRAKAMGHSVIVGGENYGQGSSREHAAVITMVLGVEAVLAKSYARIHKENLINYGILPLRFADKADYDRLRTGDKLRIEGVFDALERGEFTVCVPERGLRIAAVLDATDEDKAILRAGGAMNRMAAQK